MAFILAARLLQASPKLICVRRFREMNAPRTETEHTKARRGKAIRIRDRLNLLGRSTRGKQALLRLDVPLWVLRESAGRERREDRKNTVD